MESEPGIMRHLREATRDLHRDAETRPLQRAMAKGHLSTGSYVMYLGQLRHIHEALERSLDAAHESRPELSALFTDERRRLPDLDADLEAFDVSPDTVPVLPATETFMSRISELEASNPIALLGPLYVLEGSTNGGRFLARVLERSMQIEAGAGLSYLDPYGERQPEMWAAFKNLADALALSPAEAAAVTEEARQTFRAISEISDAILPPRAE